MTATLSQVLRAETTEAHTLAERSGIMRSLLRGTITRGAYVSLLRNLAGIYRPLEEELDRHASHPALVGIKLNSLRRLDRLECDIAALSVDLPSVATAEAPATREYAARLREIGHSSPELLLAHAYVRYMGDLSGGMMLSGIVARTLGIAEEQGGLAFFAFPDIPDPAAFKGAFRDAIDSATQFVAAPEAIVREAQYGFALHERLFRELQ